MPAPKCRWPWIGRAPPISGVRMATIGNTLRLMVAGDDEITTYREAGEQYPVTIRVLESQRRDINMVGKLTVTSTSGQPVRIDNIARLERGFGPTRITRSNRQYAINNNADIAPGYALDQSSGDLRRIIEEVNLPPGYSFQMRGQTQNLDETTDNLMLALLLASIFVYMVLAAQFESFVQPLVIMTVLPLSIPFALFTILATGRTLNLWSALGILLLFGIVKKNSILQVDYTNVLRARGVPRDEAIVDACRTRLRPILMTTLAIIFGLLPTALGVGIGGAQRSAIAVTIIGAQSLCLFLTLLLVPAAYVKLDALEHSFANQRLSAWLSKARAGTRSQNDHGRSVELDPGRSRSAGVRSRAAPLDRPCLPLRTVGTRLAVPHKCHRNTRNRRFLQKRHRPSSRWHSAWSPIWVSTPVGLRPAAGGSPAVAPTPVGLPHDRPMPRRRHRCTATRSTRHRLGSRILDS